MGMGMGRGGGGRGRREGKLLHFKQINSNIQNSNDCLAYSCIFTHAFSNSTYLLYCIDFSNGVDIDIENVH